MSIYRFTRADFENFTVVANPVREYSSSSLGEIGAIHVAARRSVSLKDLGMRSAFVDVSHDASSLDGLHKTVNELATVIRNKPAANTAVNRARLNSAMGQYLTEVNHSPESSRNQTTINIVRSTPTFNYSQETCKKLFVKNVLNKYHRTAMPSAHFAYTNYNCLNFFTGSGVPNGSALLYPNIDGPDSSQHLGHSTGTYALSGAFSFDFYINPCYNQDQPDKGFKAGTIFHLSSSYALSLISGSQKDENGRTTGFRLLLQLSHSAEVLPSLALPGTGQKNLVFLSSDNALQFNRWQHCIVRWGTDLINNGTGSFNVEGADRGTFVIPSGTIAPRLFNASPGVLSIGNFYEGADEQKLFFSTMPAIREGLAELDSSAATNEPANYTYDHPLNAQLHDVSIKRYYMTNADIIASASVGVRSIDENRIALYLPPFFVEESPFRQFAGDQGGILQTPFFEVNGTTNDPFNVALSFGVGGHYINTENFVRDFASNVFPRLHRMSGSAIGTSTALREANEFLYDDPFVRRRNLFIMPCDDGAFVPQYDLLRSESAQTKYTDDLGFSDASLITLDNMVLDASNLFGTAFDSNLTSTDQQNAFVNELIGPTPEQPGLPPGAAMRNYYAQTANDLDPGVQNGVPLTMFNRTKDPSSNQISLFDISNLYYGKRIMPGSVVITDASMSGSGGLVSMTLQDDKFGNLYPANSAGPHATWNSVGNVYYDEGLILIKSPHLNFFGKDAYELSFRGEQGIHVMKLHAFAPSNQLNSSSNPNFTPVRPSGYANDPDEGFVWITGIHFFDDNFNTVVKAQLAQPIMKRHSEKLEFVVKIDV
jgi:hypothetical protein